ncbi:hypothetical protein SAMN02745131_00103 [Flavisolibacter ginsengisoli DSM 18119]|uniref:Uncharacterized protein n=1 Tax=Flavisolibacter ginsengisoli DSM 18119 TaxID=1121884 RepID=A0A1M4SFY8_9BACT|nr:hypothetical protein SAMN02745131_00103 [Flavisolibacter ginsengisoli DSM 18119]
MKSDLDTHINFCILKKAKWYKNDIFSLVENLCISYINRHHSYKVECYPLVKVFTPFTFF